MKVSKLIKAQKEYIKLLEKASAETSIYARIHGYRADQKDIEKGDELRAEIKKYEKENIRKVQKH